MARRIDPYSPPSILLGTGRLLTRVKDRDEAKNMQCQHLDMARRRGRKVKTKTYILLPLENLQDVSFMVESNLIPKDEHEEIIFTVRDAHDEEDYLEFTKKLDIDNIDQTDITDIVLDGTVSSDGLDDLI